MASGLQRSPGARARPRPGSLVVVAAVLAILGRGCPLARAYLEKLAGLHRPAVLAAFTLAAVAAFLLLALLVRRRPAAAAAAWLLLGATMAALSGSAATVSLAALLLAGVFVLGDAIARAARGVEPGPGDLTSSLAAGLVALGLLVLLLGEAGSLSARTLGAALALVAAMRWRRLPALVRLVRAGVRLPSGDAPGWLEALWLSFAALVVLAAWAGALSPDVSWDGLAYHLPEARDIAAAGGVAARPDLFPHSFLWRNHDAALAAGFLFGDERVVGVLQFASGLAVFGAALALARRVGAAGASALVVLALAAFPTAMLQLRATYADWPAALLVGAAAAELAAARGNDGRLRLGALLFAGAVATKIFALGAAPALAILAWRARPRWRPLAMAGACFFVVLLPWAAWSARRAGSVVAPYAASPGELVGRIAGGHYFTTSPASGAAAAPRPARERVASFLRLPYDLVFHSSRFEQNRDGYNGMFVLVLLVGLAGWGGRGRGLFLLAALPVLVPWSLLYLPSVRYLFPVYPLYAVFGAEGLCRLTGRFAGRAGALAGLALVAAAAAFPVQFGSSGLEWRAAFGRAPRAGVLAARLPDYPLQGRIAAGDVVLFFGENDRFYCPAATVWRDDYLPVAAWGRDPEAWRRGLDALGVTRVLYRADRRRAEALLEALADRLEPIGENGPARLYRVRPKGAGLR